MLHPARLRKNLLMLLLVDSNNLSVMIENDEAIAGRALIQSTDVFSHIFISFRAD
jgi:hypothetical protein